MSGAWFGWSQTSRRDPKQVNFFVQRGTAAPIRVNAAGTRGLGGAITGRRVLYVQQDRGKRRLQIHRFDLRTKKRTPLPASVNNARYKGQRIRITGRVTVSGPWLSYAGAVPDEFFGGLDLVVLHHLGTGRTRIVSEIAQDHRFLDHGQVNGDWITWINAYVYDETDEAVLRYNIRTKRYVSFTPDDRDDLIGVFDPAVSSDGTVYYWHATADTASGVELVRQPVRGRPEVVTTLEPGAAPSRTFVKDRPDGSNAVFYAWSGDLYRVVDDPSDTATD
jgi:hypothetical protein